MKKNRSQFADEVMKEIPETTYYLLDTRTYSIKTVSVTGVSENCIWVNEKRIEKGEGYTRYCSSKEEIQEAVSTYTDYQIPEMERVLGLLKKLKKHSDDLTE